MCKLLNGKTVLGARTIGYTFMEVISPTDCGAGEMVSLSEKDIRDALANGEDIKGFHLSEDGKSIELDEAINIMKLTGLSYSPLKPITGMITEIFTLYGVDEKNKVYRVLTSKYGRKELTENQVRSMGELGAVMNGIYIEGNEIRTWFKNDSAGEVVNTTENAHKKK